MFVNRIWQFHFGEGLVRSVDDFGAMGAPPTHPELLDWLAVRFVQQRWDIKWPHRQIMLSSVYRQSSAEDPAKMAADPANKLLWRQAPFRLDAEAIRDSMLQVSGLLSPAMFGSQLRLKRSSDGQWLEDDALGNPNRRSVYLAYTRTRPQGFLRAFDCPDTTSDSQSQRFRPALPVQALALLNNPFVRRASLAFAADLWPRGGGSADEAILLAFESAYGRKPDAAEREIARKAIAGDTGPKAALALLLQAMMGANDFLYRFR